MSEVLRVANSTIGRLVSLRLVVFTILLGDLVFQEPAGVQLSSVLAALGYVLTGVAFVLLGDMRSGSRQPAIHLTVVDAAVTLLVLYSHLLSGPIAESHGMTTTSLVVAFILLNNVGLANDSRLVVVFSSIVFTGWIAMLVAMALRHQISGADSFVSSFFNRDLGLALCFVLASAVLFAIARNRDAAVLKAIRSDARRRNLSRFFSPTILDDLQEAGPGQVLQRRKAAVMFVDLRNFTTFAEDADVEELTCVLSTYRSLVSEVVLRHGGTVDKYIGDGVMALFGHPACHHDDADRALECALDLVDALADWTRHCLSQGGRSLRAGIGLHYGVVAAGVLEGGCHSEYTAIGDTVNVAQRLEAYTKSVGSPLAISRDLAANLTRTSSPASWIDNPSVRLPGRRVPLDVLVLRTGEDDFEGGRPTAGDDMVARSHSV